MFECHKVANVTRLGELHMYIWFVSSDINDSYKIISINLYLRGDFNAILWISSSEYEMLYGRYKYHAMKGI